jgi:hypothetical protein
LSSGKRVSAAACSDSIDVTLRGSFMKVSTGDDTDDEAEVSIAKIIRTDSETLRPQALK